MIELVVAVVILGILMSIVLVGVTSGREGNEQSQAEQAIQAVVLAQYDHASRTGTYTADPERLVLPEGPPTTTGTSMRLPVVSIAAGSDGSAGLAAATDSGCVLATLNPPWGEGGVTTWVDPQVACTGLSALPPGAHPVAVN